MYKSEPTKILTEDEVHSVLDAARKKNPKITMPELQKVYEDAAGIKRYEPPAAPPSFTSKPLRSMSIGEQTNLFHYDKVAYEWMNANRDNNITYEMFAERFYGAFVYDKDWEKKWKENNG